MIPFRTFGALAPMRPCARCRWSKHAHEYLSPIPGGPCHDYVRRAPAWKRLLARVLP